MKNAADLVRKHQNPEQEVKKEPIDNSNRPTYRYTVSYIGDSVELEGRDLAELKEKAS